MATTGGDSSIASTGALSTVVGPNTKLTYAQIEGLWIQQGGDRSLAPLMAAIAMAESGGKPYEIFDNPSTGDYSVGLWQINYYDGLYSDRAAKFGTPESLRRDPAAQARAANSILHSQGLSAWSTYTRGNYKQFLQGNVPPDTSSVWGTGATSGNGATPAGLTSPTNADCLIPMPSVGSSIGIGGSGQCLLTRQQGQQLLGGAVMLAGGAVMAFGVLLLVAIAFRRKGQQAIQVITGITPQGAFRRGFSQLTARQAAAGAGRQAAAGASSAPKPPAGGPLLEPIPKPSTGPNPPAGPSRGLPKPSRSTQQSAARLRKEGPTIQRGQPRGTVRP